MIDKKNLAEEIGRKLKEVRKRRRLDQKSVAFEIGKSVSLISDYENGRKIPNIERLYHFCQIYKVEVADLLPKSYSVFTNKVYSRSERSPESKLAIEKAKEEYSKLQNKEDI